MKQRVIVTFKDGVLDPQGKTIQQALVKQGHSHIRSVRQGKYFEIEFDDQCPAEQAQQITQRISREVLSNPVIENFRVEEEQ